MSEVLARGLIYCVVFKPYPSTQSSFTIWWDLPVNILVAFQDILTLNTSLMSSFNCQFIDAEIVAFYWPSHNREIGTPVLLHSSKSLLWKKSEFMFPSHVLLIFLFRSGLNCIHWSQVYYWMDNYVRGKYRSLTKYIFVAVGKLQAQNFWPKLKVCINPGIWIYRNFKVP